MRGETREEGLGQDRYVSPQVPLIHAAFCTCLRVRLALGYCSARDINPAHRTFRERTDY